MHSVSSGPGRIILVRHSNPSTVDEVKVMAADIAAHLKGKAPLKGILCADFRTELAFAPDVLEVLKRMMTHDNELMERSAVLMSRNAVGLTILNAVREVSSSSKRIVSCNAQELVRWLGEVAQADELEYAKQHLA